ncbi:hypothetical protein F5Y16DRAFT_102761 [Xylariaceae sp. FL0255]|nr:hypothetical protein F5Y16DRAFT_102761 [Xylariaceae sp. FL0255]
MMEVHPEGYGTYLGGYDYHIGGHESHHQDYSSEMSRPCDSRDDFDSFEMYQYPWSTEELATDTFTGLDTSLPKGGKPTIKKRVDYIDIAAVLVSLASLAVAIASVANERFSWHLGQGTNQLILLGFLLSIMNICFLTIAPTLFLLIEVRFGSSTLHNLDGILRNSISAHRLSWNWRFVLTVVLAIPVGLSVAYKRFIGGSSTLQIDPQDFITSGLSYGLVALPGLEDQGLPTGTSLLTNSTLDYARGTSPIGVGEEPSIPAWPQAYGYNILQLDSDTSAALDLPQSSYISEVQSTLADGEAWTISAPVLGTVATLNQSKTADPLGWNQTFMSRCIMELYGPDLDDSITLCSTQNNACLNTYGSGTYSHNSLLNGWTLQLLSNASPGDQSYQYIGMLPDPGTDYISQCWVFSQYAQLFDIVRKQCQGTWSITRGNIRLLTGSCNGTLSDEKQYPITRNDMFLGVFYTQPLIELIGPFSVDRKNSSWSHPYFATAVATMLWSRIAALDSADRLLSRGQELVWTSTPDGKNLTYEQVGLFYSINQTVLYTRPTLEKSKWLYVVLAVQPILSLIAMGCIALLHSTPVGKGFNLPAILSGVQPEGLKALSGASFSGKLSDDYKIAIRPIHVNDMGVISYRVLLPSEDARHEKLRKGVLYQ